MPIMSKQPESKYTPGPEGLHAAVGADVEDLGEELNTFNGRMDERVRITFQLEEVNVETGKRYVVSRKYKNSLHEKATLRKHLESWRGRKFTEEELRGFDLERLIGAPCQVQVVHELGNDGKVFAVVQAVVPLSKGMPPVAVSPDYVRRKDRPQQPAPVGRPMITDDDVPF